MSYKTITVYLSDKARTEAILTPAINLAERYGAHLVGIHVYPSVPASPLPMPFSSQVLSGIAAGVQQNADGIAETFGRMTSQRNFVSECRILKVAQRDLTSVVMEQGRTSDLVIAGQTDAGWDLAPLLDFPERLAMEVGRPVLVVPSTHRPSPIGKTVAVAWKPTRESARAVFDSMPLLQAAENVHILSFKEEAGEAEEKSTSWIADALGRHGIKPTAHSAVAPADVGAGILAQIADLGADLLVMGAYGHSRLREIVFGGATRHIARSMTVPTLFSH